MRAGGDGVDQLLALDRVRIAAPLERELIVVNAARDVRGQYDRSVDRNRRARRPGPRRMKSHERNHDGGAGRKIDPQANAHQSLLPRRDHTAASARRKGRGARSL